MKISKQPKMNIAYVVTMLVGMPLFYLVVNSLFFRGNGAAYSYVDSYIANSNKIEITLPRFDSIEDKHDTYTYKLVKGPSGTKRYCQSIFYSNEHNKYLTLIFFMGFDLDKEFYNFDLEQTRDVNIYSHMPTILAYANKVQWNDSKYGTKVNPMPIFLIKITALDNGRDVMQAGDEEKYCVLRKEIIHKYVEQYLARFLPKEEFNRLFGKN